MKIFKHYLFTLKSVIKLVVRYITVHINVLIMKHISLQTIKINQKSILLEHFFTNK